MDTEAADDTRRGSERALCLRSTRAVSDAYARTTLASATRRKGREALAPRLDVDLRESNS